jgi:hypothetical protein
MKMDCIKAPFPYNTLAVNHYKRLQGRKGLDQAGSNSSRNAQTTRTEAVDPRLDGGRVEEV